MNDYDEHAERRMACRCFGIGTFIILAATVAAVAWTLT